MSGIVGGSKILMKESKQNETNINSCRLAIASILNCQIVSARVFMGALSEVQ
jgi:hypothetical protein